MPHTSSQSAAEAFAAPRIDDVVPAAALPGGEIELTGAKSWPARPGSAHRSGRWPARTSAHEPASRLAFHVPDQATTGMVTVSNSAGSGNAAPLRVARQLFRWSAPRHQPGCQPLGHDLRTISGQRGKQTPVSIVRVSPDGRGTPFVTGILNATGLAFSPDGDLFVTVARRGHVYRIDDAGEPTVYAEGMGRSHRRGLRPRRQPLSSATAAAPFSRSIPSARSSVYATLEPSIAAYHLALDAAGTLYVTGPTLSSNDAIWAIDHARRSPPLVPRHRPSARPGARPGRQRLPVRLSPRPTRPGTHHPALAKQPSRSPAQTSSASRSLRSEPPSSPPAKAVYDVDLGVEGLNLF